MQSGVFSGNLDSLLFQSGAILPLHPAPPTISNSNTTTFNRSGQQLLTLDGSYLPTADCSTPPSISRPIPCVVAGAAGSLVVRNDLTFTSGDAGRRGPKQVEVNGALAMSGVHLGTGKNAAESERQPNPLTGNGSGRFGNLELTSTATNVTFATAANLQVTVPHIYPYRYAATAYRICGNLLTLSGGLRLTGATAGSLTSGPTAVRPAGVSKIF